MITLCFPCFSQENTRSTAITTVPLTDVKITGGPFFRAQQTNINYLLKMDPERLLAPYRREAGLPSTVESYPNWENTGLDGHIGGHYLSALSLAYAATGDKEVLRRLTYMVNELDKCQKAHGNGYLGAIPNGTKIWQQIANGEIEADLFTLNNGWVPWYNVHKVFAGLRDAFLYTNNTQAKAMLIAFSDWILTLSSKLTDQQIQHMLRTEYGGINETLADVYAITGEEQYLQLAKRYTDLDLLNPLLKKHDQLTGLHANTQIPKIVGVARIAQLNNNATWLDSADYFWQQVVAKRSVSIGGNSVREHFHPSEDFTSMIKEVEGPETCNTYNMLKLSKLLYENKHDLQYIDYYERALYNHILSSQHPVHGGLVYFTPMRPNHYRVYSAPEQGMWCCVGSGIENHSKYGAMIYASREDDFYINLFVDSEVYWRNKNIKLSQRTQFPDNENSTVHIHNAGKFSLNIRYPAWVTAGQLSISVNDQAVDMTASPGEYIQINRTWSQGDVVSIHLPMHTSVEPLPDQSNYYSILHGPIVLAAKTTPFDNEKLNFIADSSRMGHIAQGPVCPTDKVPVFLSNADSFINKIKPVVDSPLTFTTGQAATNQESPLTLIPFFRLHDSRYTLYFPQSSPAQWQKEKQKLVLEAQAEIALAERTLDHVQPGQQQPESDHFFQAQQSEAGLNGTKHWRHARGWFSYLMQVKGEQSVTLQLTFYGLDKDRNFDVFIDDKLLSTISLTGTKGAVFYHENIDIPAHLITDPTKPFRLTFKAKENSIAGGIYGIRLLKK
ncbi:glycoside hydrolase family 127 protein [Thalassotalea sp. G2M2-11]|uniref:glycoside hydrolase family 127 protein n=1 Tax=Thalassotalea sp. G2M2-11 TaxID=2787627 RepID=UPI0019D153D7|nr:glycoside hydrolase family 127 protein [Thalassotalea sp. G2M2-11]